jgi:uncharacterized protein involved in outer membrane biogenesis
LSRRPTLIVAISLVAVALAAAGLWALPEVVRRVALGKIPELTGRAASIEDVDLDLFTGRFAIKNLRIAERPGYGPEAFLQVARLDGRVALSGLLRSDVRLTELTLSHPVVHFTRTASHGFNVSDLLGQFGAVAGEDTPTGWTISLDRLDAAGASIVIDDAVPAPAQQWRIEDLTLEASALTTRPDQPPGRLRLRARVGGARLDVSSRSIELTPARASLSVSLTGFDVARIAPYLPAGLAVVPETGTIDLALGVQPGDTLASSLVSGEVRTQGLSCAWRDHPTPFVRADRVIIAVERMDLLGRDLRLKSVDVGGLGLEVVRGNDGRVDLATLGWRHAEPSAAGAGHDAGPAGPADESVEDAVPSLSRPSSGPGKLTIERLALRSATVTLTDRAVSPARLWKIDHVTADGAALSTDTADAPGMLRVTGRIRAQPGSATPADLAIDAHSVRLAPPRVSARVTLHGLSLAAIEPYWPPSVPATARGGAADIALNVEVEQRDGAVARALASGRARFRDLAVARRGSPTPFVTVPGLLVEIKALDPLARRLALGAVEVDGVDMRAVRDATGRLDLLGLGSSTDAAVAIRLPGESGRDEDPSRQGPATGAPERAAGGEAGGASGTLTLEELTVRAGTITVSDEAVSPPREWKIEGLAVEGAQLGTAPGASGALRAHARLRVEPGVAKPAVIDVDAHRLVLFPLAVSARASVRRFPLDAIRPYWAATAPMVTDGGVVSLAFDFWMAQGQGGLSRAIASGDADIDQVRLLQRGRSQPFLTIPNLVIRVKRLDAIARDIGLATVEVKGANLRVSRDEAGRVDLLDMLRAAEPAIEEVKARTGLGVGAESFPIPPVAGPRALARWRVNLDRFSLDEATLTFEDARVARPVSLELTGVSLNAEHVTWPLTKPATLSFMALMPGGGRTSGTGTVMIEPLNAQIALSTRDAPITPYRSYLPFAAKLEGLFNGDSLSEIQRGPHGELILASRGTAWANSLRVLAPGEAEPVVSMDSMMIRGIDLSWPNYALVEKVALVRPRVRLEREPHGDINLRTLFAMGKSAGGSRDAAGSAATAAGAPGSRDRAARNEEDGGRRGMVIDISHVAIRNGIARFLDRTFTPPFSEDVSRLRLDLTNLSNGPEHSDRTTLTAQGLLGEDSAFDMRGHFSGTGHALRADLVAELRHFSLPSANPYIGNLTSWIAQTGMLEAKAHYRIEGDRVTADHGLALRGLYVEKAAEQDRAEQRLGIPLGIAVALLKDSRGDIELALPLRGTLHDGTFDWGEAMWAAARQLVGKLVLAPFRAIGRVLREGGGEPELEVNPVSFSPGSAVIAPSAEVQLGRIATFLRRSPHVGLSLAPVLAGTDVEALKVREVRRRLEAFRRAQGLPDLPAALLRYYAERVGAAAPPATVQRQIELLVEREPAPERLLVRLAERRLAAVRETLVKREVSADRVTTPPLASVSAASTPAATGQGQVELAIVAIPR